MKVMRSSGVTEFTLKAELEYWKWGAIEREEATMTSRLLECTTTWEVG